MSKWIRATPISASRHGLGRGPQNRSGAGAHYHLLAMATGGLRGMEMAQEAMHPVDPGVEARPGIKPPRSSDTRFESKLGLPAQESGSARRRVQRQARGLP
jgi:hypothetical protein